jgi:heterodisulfide reductase subunit A
MSAKRTVAIVAVRPGANDTLQVRCTCDGPVELAAADGNIVDIAAACSLQGQRAVLARATAGEYGRVEVEGCRHAEARTVLESWADRSGLELSWDGERTVPPEVGPRLVKEALVIGGGVAGVQAALDIAEGGYRTYLVESTYSIGGIMAALDKTFPTMDCSICILGPKLVDASKHESIELLVASKVTGVEGAPGDYRVTIDQAPTYVDTSRCNGCGACVEACPVVVPNEWDLNLKPRKAIHTMFAQAVPMKFAIDEDACIECGMCMNACGLDAIDLSQEPTTRALEVGAIVLATGVGTVPGDAKKQFGYGVHTNVVTNMEFERIICASGPTEGHLYRPDGKPYKRVAFIQCVGSRDRSCRDYCSMYCCIASIKEARLVMEHADGASIHVFYNDLRASGKGFEELYVRSQAEGMRFVKGLPSEVREDPTTLDPIVAYEDVASGTRKELEVDLVVLAMALEPSRDLASLSGMLGIELDEDGFVRPRQAHGAPLETASPGVFIAGACSGPRDIPETVAQASGSASKVCAFFEKEDRP